MEEYAVSYVYNFVFIIDTVYFHCFICDFIFIQYKLIDHHVYSMALSVCLFNNKIKEYFTIKKVL